MTLTIQHRQIFMTALVALAMTGTFFSRGTISIFMGVAVCMGVYQLWCERSAARDIIAVKSGDGTIAREPFLIGLIFVSWFVSCFYGLNPDKAMDQWLRLAGISVAGMVLYLSLAIRGWDWPVFYRFTAVSAAVFSAMLLAHTVLPFFPDGMVKSSYGSVLAIILPFAIYHVLMSGKKIPYLMIFVIAAAIFASGGRTAWVAVMLGVSCFLLFFPWRAVAGRWVCILCLIGAVIGGGFAGLNLYKMSVGETVYERRVVEVDTRRPASGRLEIWADTVQTIDNNLWRGVGIKGFRELNLIYDSGRKPSHAHNVILELLVDTGVSGFFLCAVFVSWMVFRFLVAYWRTANRGSRAVALPVFMACVIYGICSMALTSLFHSWWFLYLVVLLILLGLATRMLERERLLPCRD